MVVAHSLHLNAKLPVFGHFPTGIPPTSHWQHISNT
jgi:hypothetical protein